MQNDIEQRFVNQDAAVVFNKAEIAKSIHEETDTGSRGADHLRQRFLRDLRDECLHLARFTKFGHQQQNPCQALLAGVEKLIDEISLSSHAAGKQKLQEQIGEGMLLVQHADHLRTLDLERRAAGNRSGRRQSKANRSGD